MLTTENDLEMTQEEFVMIRDFILEKSGIYFAENKMYLLKNRLMRRMSDLGIKTYRDYFYHAKYDASNKEFNELMNLVTTNETSFFRNEPLLKSFSEEVLPKLIEAKSAKGTKSLRVWSAGCSTGEEPYTLGMMILDKLGDKPGWNVEIIANDISEQVLKRARVGEYHGTTLRNVSPKVLSQYFDRVQGKESYRIKTEIKSMIRFSQINLSDQRQISRNSNMDVIFCRNVMIYFTNDVKKQIVRGFYNCLKPGGHLYIGHSETLHGISKAFKLVYLKNALVYQKDAATTTSRPATTARTIATASRPVSKAGATGGASRALDLLSKIKPMTVKK